MSTPRESWLRSPDAQLWAAAMARCEYPLADCGQDGIERCHYRECGLGSCFPWRAERDRLAALEARVGALEAAMSPVRGGDGR